MPKIFQKPIIIYLFIVIPLSFFIWDIINTLDDRVFLDAFLYTKNPYFHARYKDFAVWNDHKIFTRWQYPPLTILYLLPAWIAFRFTSYEWLFQILFKLPQILSVIFIWKIIKNDYKIKSFARSWLTNPLIIFLSVQGGFSLTAAYLILLVFQQFKKQNYFLSFFILSLVSGLRLYPLILALPMLLHLLKKQKFYKIIYSILVLSLIFIIPFLPFIWNSPTKFFDIFRSSQTMYLGPLGLWPLAQKLFQKIYSMFSLKFNYLPFYYFFSFLTFLSVLYTSFYSFKKKFSLLKTFLLILAFFYLLYPKMHAGYDLPLFIFGAIFAKKNKLKTNPFKNIWIFPFLFMMLINGNFDTNGLFYLLLPFTKLYFQIPFSFYLHLLICFFQEIIILKGIVKIIKT